MRHVQPRSPAKCSQSVMAIEYGSWPIEQPALPESRKRRGPPCSAQALDPRKDAVAEEVEVVRLAEEIGLVGRQAIDHHLAFRPCGSRLAGYSRYSVWLPRFKARSRLASREQTRARFESLSAIPASR